MQMSSIQETKIPDSEITLSELIHQPLGVNQIHGLTYPNTPLVWLCGKGTAEQVQSLIDANADVNLQCSGLWTKSTSPLHESFTRPEIMKVLLEAKADPNLRNGLGETPLQVATRYDAMESVALLKQ
jgi:ankyrin repeat protein